MRSLRLVRGEDRPPALADAESLARVRRGDPSGSEALYGRYAAPLLGFTTRMLGNRAEAEETTQDVFLRMIDRADQYDGRAPVSSWLFAIAANACRDRLRASRRAALPLEAVPDPPAKGESAEARVLADERSASVRRAMALLSDEQREALVLARFHELPYSEIAETLGITEGAVKTRIYRAMETLKAHFAQGDRPWTAAMSPRSSS